MTPELGSAFIIPDVQTEELNPLTKTTTKQQQITTYQNTDENLNTNIDLEAADLSPYS